MISFPRKKPPLVQYIPYEYQALDSAFVRISKPSDHTWVRSRESKPWNCVTCCTTPCMKDVEVKPLYGEHGVITTKL